MRERSLHLALLPLSLITVMTVLAACSGLKSESGLYGPDVSLNRSLWSGVDGYWIAPSADAQPVAPRSSGLIYVAPTRMGDGKATGNGNKEMHSLCAEMRELTKQYLEAALREGNAANQTNWHVTDNEAQADLIIRTALINYRPQLPLVRLAGTIGSFFVPIPGTGMVADKIAGGNIGMELTCTDARTGRILTVVKDSNKSQSMLWESNYWVGEGNAMASIDIWAREYAQFTRNSAPDKLQGKTLSDAVASRGFGSYVSDWFSARSRSADSNNRMADMGVLEIDPATLNTKKKQ